MSTDTTDLYLLEESLNELLDRVNAMGESLGVTSEQQVYDIIDQ